MSGRGVGTILAPAPRPRSGLGLNELLGRIAKHSPSKEVCYGTCKGRAYEQQKPAQPEPNTTVVRELHDEIRQIGSAERDVCENRKNEKAQAQVCCENFPGMRELEHEVDDDDAKQSGVVNGNS